MFSKSLNTLLLPDVETFDIAQDKWRFHEFLERNEIPSPFSFLDADAVLNERQVINFPVLKKPRIGMGGFGIKRLNDLKALKNSLQEDVLYQEFIDGFDIDMSVICKEGNILAYTIQKGYIFMSSSYSAALGMEFLKNEKLFMTVQQMMKAMNWSGFAHIDLIYDSHSDHFKVLEINPRVWGSIEASECVGINFPYYYVLTSLGISYEMPNYKNETCANTVGIIKILKSKFPNKKSIPFPDHYYKWSSFFDPLPLLYDSFFKFKQKYFGKRIE